MIIVDAHEDLAYNVLADGRNYLQSAYETRAEEEGGPVPELNGECMLGLPEWLKGGVAVVFATLFTMPRAAAKVGELSYPNPEGARQQALAQLNIYRQWAAEQPQLSLMTQRQHLDQVLASWPGVVSNGQDKRQVGLVLLMENAEPIRQPDEVGFWVERGVRLIGPAWQANRYTGSTSDGGPLTELGRQLLAAMARHNLVLDLSHMSDDACLEVLQTYPGPIVATHANPRRLVSSNRMLADTVITQLVGRGGLIGVMPANWALSPEWQRGNDKASVTLDDVVKAIDVVCQIAGDARHVGLGTDFDGGFGAEAVPAELDTIADLPRLADALARHGYGEEDVAAVMGGNWLRLLQRVLASY